MIRAALVRQLVIEQIAQRTAHVCPDGQQLRRVIGEMLDAGEITPEQFGIRRVGKGVQRQRRRK
jgi:hypothetical protein